MTVASLRRFRAALIGPTQGLPNQAASTVPVKKTETLRVRSVVNATSTRLGAWLRSREGIGWLTAGTTPNSLYRGPFYIFLACVLCYCSFVFVVFCFVFVVLFCSRWSVVDVPLIFFCPADHVQYRIGNHVYYWVWLRPDRLMWRTTTTTTADRDWMQVVTLVGLFPTYAFLCRRGICPSRIDSEHVSIFRRRRCCSIKSSGLTYQFDTHFNVKFRIRRENVPILVCKNCFAVLLYSPFL